MSLCEARSRQCKWTPQTCWDKSGMSLLDNNVARHFFETNLTKHIKTYFKGTGLEGDQAIQGFSDYCVPVLISWYGDRKKAGMDLQTFWGTSGMSWLDYQAKDKLHLNQA